MFFALFKCFFIVEGRPIWTRRAKTVPNLIGKSIKIETVPFDTVFKNGPIKICGRKALKN